MALSATKTGPRLFPAVVWSVCLCRAGVALSGELRCASAVVWFQRCPVPGGFIVPAATANGEVVVNGMSPSRRNNPYANSGIVVEINIEKDLPKYQHFPVALRESR